MISMDFLWFLASRNFVSKVKSNFSYSVEVVCPGCTLCVRACPTDVLEWGFLRGDALRFGFLWPMRLWAGWMNDIHSYTFTLLSINYVTWIYIYWYFWWSWSSQLISTIFSPFLFPSRDIPCGWETLGQLLTVTEDGACHRECSQTGGIISSSGGVGIFGLRSGCFQK